MFDRAMLDDDDFINAWSVASGEMDGFVYDWNDEVWKRKP
jgi:hypothetical protein